MKLALAYDNEVITYDFSCVYIKTFDCATYTYSDVCLTLTSETIGKIHRENGITYGTLCCDSSPLVCSNTSDHTLRLLPSNDIVASFDGTATGSIACFLTHVFFEYVKKDNFNTNKNTTVIKPHNLDQNVISKKIIPTNTTSRKEEDLAELTPKPTPTMLYKPPKLKENKKHNDFRPTSPPVPTENKCGLSFGPGFIWLCILGLVLYSAIKIIPQSWKDLSTYIPAGDSGITISFFSPLMGAILALLISIFKKRADFFYSITTFLGACIIGIIINAITLLVEGTEFTGFFLLDIPLSLFAPILGCFQFALPIGIVTFIVCGIICLVRNKWYKISKLFKK